MRIIAVANQKGGVGKTTTVVNLGAALASRGRRVAVLDLDPQAHLTASLGVDPRETTLSSYELLTASEPLEAALRQVRSNLWLLPANLNLAAAEQELVAVVGRETLLRHALDAAGSRWDYVLIDCPPSLGLLTLNALSAALELFIPLQPHFLSLQGLSQLLESVLLVHRRINPRLSVSGLLFCLYDGRTSLSAEIVSDVEAFFARQRSSAVPWRGVRLFAVRIRGNVKLAECPSHGKTIHEYAPGSHGAQDYQALADEVEAMAGGAGPAASASDAASGAAPAPQVVAEPPICEPTITEPSACPAVGQPAGQVDHP